MMFLPGCGRIIDWGKKSVDQGKDVENELKSAKDTISSSRIYDQFTLAGAFDTLWLNDDVRSLYSDLYAKKRGKTESEKNLILRRQLEENNHFISFYVLCPADFVLGEKDSDWTVLLRVDGNCFAPTEFKKVELSPEYKLMFGKKMNRFKIAYVLRYNAKDIEDRLLIQSSTKMVDLVFRTTKKEIVQSWEVKKQFKKR